MTTIGITTTIPLEILLAAGYKVLDLNNLFINSPEAYSLVEKAEVLGYPRNICAWIKGIYAYVLEHHGIDKILAVVEGDCSNTLALIETLQLKGIEIIKFAYPYDRKATSLQAELDKLSRTLGTTWEAAQAFKERLAPIRAQLRLLDELTWREPKVSGAENHLWLVTSSDFNGDYLKYQQNLDAFIAAVKQRPALSPAVRLGYCGVPPIFSDLYEFIENKGGRIIFNEVQRQFAMPYDTQDLVQQYLAYTYPYDIFARIEDIAAEVKRRNLQGLIHYVQSFCHHQIEDIILRKKVEVPVLTLEGDKPGLLDARSRLRLEAFLELLTDMPALSS
jgi:benzoyl-CoA reductase/2-hydroxyglutaryl-CoA dehydratase subunit BcrC/BadD/HgdB